jgi:hypothetical protein
MIELIPREEWERRAWVLDSPPETDAAELARSRAWALGETDQRQSMSNLTETKIYQAALAVATKRGHSAIERALADQFNGGPDAALQHSRHPARPDSAAAGARSPFKRPSPAVFGLREDSEPARAIFDDVVIEGCEQAGAETSDSQRPPCDCIDKFGCYWGSCCSDTCAEVAADWCRKQNSIADRLHVTEVDS